MLWSYATDELSGIPKWVIRFKAAHFTLASTFCCGASWLKIGTKDGLGNMAARPGNADDSPNRLRPAFRILVPHQGRGGTVPMLPAGILSRWIGLIPLAAQPHNLPFVVGPITTHLDSVLWSSGTAPAVRLASSAPRPGVSLTDGASSKCAVWYRLTHLPFSLPKDFQPGAVQDQMQGPSSFPAQGNPQALGALAEGGIVRHRHPTPASETRTGETLR